MKSLFQSVRSCLQVAAAGVLLNTTAGAAVFTFATDPFLGSTALTTPGRQIVAGEDFINFNVATDVFSFDSGVFATGSTINFASGVASALPTSGVNAISLLSFDNDANPATPFGAGNAANLIAAQITAPGAGFFIYFNQGLDLARLVYSTDLNDNTSDLKIVARLTNLTGQPGRDAMATFTAANFQSAPAAVPEPSTYGIFAAVALLGLSFWKHRGK